MYVLWLEHKIFPETAQLYIFKVAKKSESGPFKGPSFITKEPTTVFGRPRYVLLLSVFYIFPPFNKDCSFRKFKTYY